MKGGLSILFKKYIKGIITEMKKKIGYYNGNKLIKPLNTDEASNILEQKIQGEEPFLLSRFGNTELNTVFCYLRNIKCDKDKVAKIAHVNGGIFPENEKVMTEFSKIYVNSSKDIDLLICWFWLKNERFMFKNYTPNSKIMTSQILYPFFDKNPWTKSLKHKKVLVIHPFSYSIEKQYNNKRDDLFDNKLLPEFDLITYECVQSIAGETVEFDNWIAAYNKMCEDISEIEFDIALIGAGAYGLPLGSFIKSIGKQAIHLGGITQIYFGIKGKRYEKEYNYDKLLYNEYWVRPQEHEIPEGYKKVEDGAYW